MILTRYVVRTCHARHDANDCRLRITLHSVTKHLVAARVIREAKLGRRKEQA